MISLEVPDRRPPLLGRFIDPFGLERISSSPLVFDRAHYAFARQAGLTGLQ